jgi:RNA polymerase sigma-70 factor (ECF subfamily)
MQMSDIRSSSRSEVIVERDQRRQFDAVCTPLRADLFRFLFWLCHDRTLAEDVMQETLLRAWRSFESLHDCRAAKP